MSNPTTRDKVRLLLTYYSAYVELKRRSGRSTYRPLDYSQPATSTNIDLDEADRFRRACGMEELLSKMDITSRTLVINALQHWVEFKPPAGRCVLTMQDEEPQVALANDLHDAIERGFTVLGFGGGSRNKAWKEVHRQFLRGAAEWAYDFLIEQEGKLSQLKLFEEA